MWGNLRGNLGAIGSQVASTAAAAVGSPESDQRRRGVNAVSGLLSRVADVVAPPLDDEDDEYYEDEEGEEFYDDDEEEYYDEEEEEEYIEDGEYEVDEEEERDSTGLQAGDERYNHEEIITNEQDARDDHNGFTGIQNDIMPQKEMHNQHSDAGFEEQSLLVNEEPSGEFTDEGHTNKSANEWSAAHQHPGPSTEQASFDQKNTTNDVEYREASKIDNYGDKNNAIGVSAQPSEDALNKKDEESFAPIGDRQLGKMASQEPAFQEFSTNSLEDIDSTVLADTNEIRPHPSIPLENNSKAKVPAEASTPILSSEEPIQHHLQKINKPTAIEEKCNHQVEESSPRDDSTQSKTFVEVLSKVEPQVPSELPSAKESNGILMEANNSSPLEPSLSATSEQRHTLVPFSKPEQPTNDEVAATTSFENLSDLNDVLRSSPVKKDLSNLRGFLRETSQASSSDNEKRTNQTPVEISERKVEEGTKQAGTAHVVNEPKSNLERISKDIEVKKDASTPKDISLNGKDSLNVNDAAKDFSLGKSEQANEDKQGREGIIVDDQRSSDNERTISQNSDLERDREYTQQLEMELARTKQELFASQQQAEERYQKYENSIKQTNSTVQSLQQKLTKATNEAQLSKQEWRDREQQLKFQLNEYSKECETLKQERETLQIATYNQESNEKELTKQKAQQQKMLEEQTQKVHEYEQQLDRQANELQQLQKVIQNMKSTLKATTDRATKAEHLVETLTLERDELEKEIHEELDHKDEMEEEMNELKSAASRIGELEMELQMLKEERSRENQKNHSEKEAVSSNLATITEERDVARHEIQDLKQQLAALTADLELVTSDKERIMTSHENLQRALEAFQIERDSEMSLWEEQRRDAELASAEAHAAAIDAMNEANEAKMKEVQFAADKSIKNLMEEISRLESTLETCRTESRNLRRSLDEAIHRLQTTQEDVIDRSLIKNMILDWFSRKGKGRQEVLTIMSSVLHFTEDEKEKIGTGEHSGTFHKVAGAVAAPLPPSAIDPDKLEGENVREKWVNFLMAETGDDE